MRYYRIDIANDDGSPFATYTSFPNGATDPGALQIEIDIPIAPQAIPKGGSFVRIWGVSIQTISQASDFNGKSIKVYGGMQKGLPLANPAQAGLLTSGKIFQAFGNWIGTNMTVDFVILADLGAQDAPKNLVLSWPKGAQLSTVIAATIKTAFPGYPPPNIDINQKLVLTEDEHGMFRTFGDFADYIKTTSRAIIGGEYPGVDITLREKTFTVYDGTKQPDPTQIQFNDLIGQPTWIDAATVQLNCVMRADLEVGKYVTLPQAQVTTTAASYNPARDKSVFQGRFLITFMRHVGSFRQPDASAWITTFNAVPAPTMADTA